MALHEKYKVYPINELPETLEGELFITYGIQGWNVGNISVWDNDVSGSERALIGKGTFSVKIEKVDIRQKAVQALQKAKEDLMAETQKKLGELSERINQLLQIEYKPAQEQSDDMSF